MRLKLDTWAPIMIGGDYGGEPSALQPPVSMVTRTWFNRTLWDAAKTVKQRRALIAEVKRLELALLRNEEPARLGHTRWEKKP